MNTSVKSAILALGLVGIAACGVSEAETLPSTTTTAAPTTITIPVVDTTTTLIYEEPVIPVTEPSVTYPAPTQPPRPVETTVPDDIPYTVYEEPYVEPVVEEYEPMGVGPFLECVKMRESGGDYSINTGNGYYGAYQFSQSTWDNTANYAGRPDLVGVRPSDTSPATQDFMAITLYNWYGASPWAGPGC